MLIFSAGVRSPRGSTGRSVAEGSRREAAPRRERPQAKAAPRARAAKKGQRAEPRSETEKGWRRRMGAPGRGGGSRNGYALAASASAAFRSLNFATIRLNFSQ